MKRVLMDLQWLIRHFTSMDKSAAPNTHMGTSQVPATIPAETPNTQIHMNLSW